MKKLSLLLFLFCASCGDSENGHVRRTYVISHTQKDAAPVSEQELIEVDEIKK